MSDLLDKLFIKVSQICMLVVIVDNWLPAITVLRKLQIARTQEYPSTSNTLKSNIRENCMSGLGLALKAMAIVILLS